MPYKEVEALIEDGLSRINLAKLKSTLPDAPNWLFAEELVYNIHLDVIRKRF